MSHKRMLELLISLHKKVDVNALSDSGWREYQQERREITQLTTADRGGTGDVRLQEL